MGIYSKTEPSIKPKTRGLGAKRTGTSPAIYKLETNLKLENKMLKNIIIALGTISIALSLFLIRNLSLTDLTTI